ncbi:MAG: class I SAM-dependent methyltransferase, partial [Anaerolineales bacterium]|nr:class I SAM-dependent methyltransferase [Anaerolineales bacterium]
MVKDWRNYDELCRLYNSTYGNFREQVLAEVRRETYGEDIGQNSWITAEEYDLFANWLGLTPHTHVLEVASGSGGPALYLSRKYGCRITGIDMNEGGLETARQAALTANLSDAHF